MDGWMVDGWMDGWIYDGMGWDGMGWDGMAHPSSRACVLMYVPVCAPVHVHVLVACEVRAQRGLLMRVRVRESVQAHTCSGWRCAPCCVSRCASACVSARAGKCAGSPMQSNNRS